MKPLTHEGLLECGALELIKGKAAAFTAVLSRQGGVGLGLAVANEPGYYPIPMFWCHGGGEEYRAMQNHADVLNKEYFMLNTEGAARIVMSTMRRYA